MKNRFGFTLIEVMVGTVLVSLISVGMLSLIMYYARSSVRSTARQDLSELNDLVKLTLSNDKQCTSALRELNAPNGFTGGSVQLTRIFNGEPPPATATIVRSVVNQNDFGRIRIESIEITNAVTTPPLSEVENLTFVDEIITPTHPAPTATNTLFTTYRTLLTVAISVANGDGSGAVETLAPLIFPVKLYTDSTGAMKRCLLTVANNQTCTSLGGSYDHAAGLCVFPVCNSTVVLPQHQCPPAPTGGTCNPAIPTYFWGHTTDPVSGETTLVCLCTNSCVAASATPY